MGPECNQIFICLFENNNIIPFDGKNKKPSVEKAIKRENLI
jgi:hypothetical protein